MLKVKLDTTRANEVIIYFGNKMTLSLIGTIQVFISIGITNFHIVNIPNPFFLYLKNINKVGIYLNNISNQLICQNGKNNLIFYK